MKPFDALLVERDLEDAQSIQRHFYPGALGEELDVGRVPVPRGDSEQVRRTRCALDGRGQHSGGGGRRLPGPVLTDEGDFDTALGKGRRDGEANEAVPDDDYLAAQLARSSCFLS
jgi:hypothetical protein